MRQLFKVLEHIDFGPEFVNSAGSGGLIDDFALGGFQLIVGGVLDVFHVFGAEQRHAG